MKNIKKSLLMISVILVICLVNYSVIKISDRNIALVGWFIVPPIIGVIAAKIALKIEYNDKLIEFDKDYNYFRDLIKKYSPSILSVIYNSIKYPKLSMIGLLQLEKKGKIVLGDEISINPELMPVSLSEEYLLNSIKNNSLNKENDYKYYDLLISECKNNHLMYQVPVKYIYNGLIKSVVVFFIFAAFLCLVGYALHNIELNKLLISKILF